MLYIALIACVPFVFAWWARKDMGWFGIFPGIIVAWLVVLITVIPIFGLYRTPPEYYDIVTPIAAMQDNTGIVSGNLFAIRSSNEFTYYERGDDGGLRLKSVPASKTVVFDNAERAELTAHCSSSDGELTWLAPRPGSPQRCRFSLSVPKGSIVDEIRLDAG